MQAHCHNPWIAIDIIDENTTVQPTKADSEKADLKKADVNWMPDAKTLVGDLGEVAFSFTATKYCYFAGEQLRIQYNPPCYTAELLRAERLLVDTRLLWVYGGVQDAKKRYQRYPGLHKLLQKTIVVVDTDQTAVEIKAEFKNIPHVFPLNLETRFRKIGTEISQALSEHDAGVFALSREGILGIICSYIYDTKYVRDDLLRYAYSIAYHNPSKKAYSESDARGVLAQNNSVVDNDSTYYGQIKKTLLSYAKTKVSKERKDHVEHLLKLTQIAGEFYSDYKEAEIANKNLISGIKDVIKQNIFPQGSNWFLKNIFKTPEHCLAVFLEEILKTLEAKITNGVFHKPRVYFFGSGGGGGE